MANGTGTLWHANFKINAATRGFNFKCHFAEVEEATARLRCAAIGGYLKNLLPSTVEIVYAAISKDDTAKDARSILSGRGFGLYGQGGVDPTPTYYDNARSAYLVRFENENGQVVTRKFCPIPDAIVEDEELLGTVAPVVAPIVGDIPIPGAGADWYAEMNALLKYMVANTHHVRTGHAPGGLYTYFAWQAAIPARIGVKKGGRVFN